MKIRIFLLLSLVSLSAFGNVDFLSSKVSFECRKVAYGAHMKEFRFDWYVKYPNGECIIQSYGEVDKTDCLNNLTKANQSLEEYKIMHITFNKKGLDRTCDVKSTNPISFQEILNENKKLSAKLEACEQGKSSVNQADRKTSKPVGEVDPEAGRYIKAKER